MNTKPNIPDEIGLWTGKPYSLRDCFKAGAGWMMLVYLTDVPGSYLMAHHPEWPIALRIIIALIPIAAALLYVRGVVQWIRGMDELHRKITLTAFGFATVTYLFLAAAWSQLMDRAGIFENIFDLSRLQALERMPFSNCSFIVALTWVLFCMGFTIFNRRYK
ncbi:MAG TPA: hypothetical protein VGN23_05770 [Verrucomicrobiae bacterium]|jgi:hypothetical protein